MANKTKKIFSKWEKRMNPKVSIIIPVYNAEQYIGECLNSVSRQTLTEIEILCIDDCSTDNSVERLKRAAINDSRVILIQNEHNLGAGETRNRGIMLARGKYFFFLDADDFLETDAIEKLYCCAEDQELQLCFCSHVNYNDADKVIGKTTHTTDVFLKRYRDQVFSWNEVQRFLYQNIYCVPWNRLYLTDFVRNSPIRFPDLKNSEDLFFGEAIVTMAERMGVADSEHPLVYYRRGRKGQISSTVGRNPYCMLESIKLLYDFLKSSHKLGGMEKCYHTIMLELLLFPIQAAEQQEQVIRYTVEQGFPEIGMSDLTGDDFTNIASYKKYCELLKGRKSNFDTYMVSVMEDRKKLNIIGEFLQQNKDRKTALWGMAKKGQILLHELEKINREFDYYIDVNPSKAGETMKERKIYRYEEITEQLDYIMITNMKYFEEIYIQCKKSNPSCKIIDLDTFFRCDMTLEECMA